MAATNNNSQACHTSFVKGFNKFSRFPDEFSIFLRICDDDTQLHSIKKINILTRMTSGLGVARFKVTYTVSGANQLYFVIRISCSLKQKIDRKICLKFDKMN